MGKGHLFFLLVFLGGLALIGLLLWVFDLGYRAGYDAGYDDSLDLGHQVTEILREPPSQAQRPPTPPTPPA
jgi:hypothetical protein